MNSSHPQNDQNDDMNAVENRADRIVRMASQETGVRDLLTFALGRAWSVLLVVASSFFVIVEKYQTSTNSAEDSADGKDSQGDSSSIQ